MTVSLLHSVPADGSFSAVGAAAWDAQHVLTQATDRLLGRTTAGVGATEEITVGAGLTLSGGTLINAGATSPIGGSNTQVQFNDGGVFAGNANFTFDKATNQIAIAAGTAAAPTLIPTGDTNTGVWFPAADTIAASTGGTERFRILSSGNVGIGTTAPTTLLSVNGVASFGAGTAALPSVARFGDLDTGMWFPAANQVAWSTNGTEKMRLDTNGFLGIGTSSPSVNLDIRSASAFLPQLLLVNSTVGFSAPYWNSRKLRGTAAADLYDNLGTFVFQSADTGGTIRNACTFETISLGAGSTYHSAYMQLSVVTAAGVFAPCLQAIEGQVRTAAGTAALPGISQISDPDTGMWWPTANTLAWSTGGSERLRITSAGNLGLGTSTFGTSAATAFAIATGTAPTTGPADTIQIYSTDLSAGNTMLSLYTEGTVVNANTTAATTHRIAIRVNGTVYYLLANTAA